MITLAPDNNTVHLTDDEIVDVFLAVENHGSYRAWMLEVGRAIETKTLVRMADGLTEIADLLESGA